MEKGSILKRGCILFVIFVFIFNIPLVLASNVSDLNSQKKDLDAQKKEVESELSGVTKDKSATMTEVEKLISQIGQYEDEISNLDTQLSSLNEQIADSQARLDKATQDYMIQEDLLHKRLVALYKAGETTYLDFILSSTDITDFLSKYYLASELASYDLQLLENINNQKIEIENAKKELEENKTKVNSVKQEKQTKSNALEKAKTQKNQQVSKLSQEEKQLKEELEQIQKEQKEVDAKIKQIEQASKNQGNGGSSSGTPVAPSAAGFIRPVVGYSITTGYYGYAGHTGVDYSGSGIHNKPILAVKDGTVIISEALIKNGKYYSYGEYVVIDHGNGLSTLYGHGEPGSRTVSVGDKVKQGQTIMRVGTTGNSTGYHLHFGVRVNGSYVNPTPYLP